MNPRLVGISGPFQGALFALPEGDTTLGRDSSNQICAVDSFLSRRHCMLTRNGRQILLRDLESHNGTRVNGLPAKEQQLRHGDRVSAGGSLLVFLLDDDEAGYTTTAVEEQDATEMHDFRLRRWHRDEAHSASRGITESVVETPRLTRDLNAMLKIATGIGGIRDRESLQWQLLGFLFDVVPAERGAVLFFDDSGETTSTAAWDRARGPEYAVTVNEKLVQRVRQERVGVILDEATDDTDSGAPTVAEKAGTHSILCVPLMCSGKISGIIYLDTRRPQEKFDDDHLQVVTAVAGIAALALDNLRHWELLQQENQALRAEINLDHNMIGDGPRMKEVLEFVRRVAPSEATVLLMGESGTGKELVARAIHRNSPRAEMPFVAINCAAITETLLESELFGHEKGAFTGAAAQKKGKIEIAEGGTLFLDEVSELALGLQAKLLRVLQEREFERVGGTTSIPLDIRLVAATNCSLTDAVEAGSFRKDLYYRLNVVAFSMPALRERREDIPQLAEYFLAKSSRKSKTRSKRISPEARACLMNYEWPGNVRELENAIERALVLGPGEIIMPDDLPEAVVEGGAPSSDPAAKYHGAVKESKKQLILQALQQANGSYLEAAKVLGIHPNSLLRLIRNLDIRAAVKATAPPSRGN